MSKTTTRKFALSYDQVVTKAQSIQPQYMTDQEQFTAFDPTFTAEMGQELDTQLQEALEDHSSSSHGAAIMMKTEEITDLRKSGTEAFKNLLYYVHAAFGEKKAIDKAFGRQQYEKARNSEKVMIEMLKQAYQTATDEKFRPQLEAKGLSEVAIEKLNSLATLLTKADNEQEMLKKQQLLVTEQRINLYNSIWDKMIKINTAAKIIFQDDPARLAIYQLYDQTSSSISEPEIETEESSNT